ncbi:MAG: serine--tRNA ligase [Desulfobacterales bacterium]|nr:serine--tRNA ligase [Desulfobacterales bacterium]
MLDLKFIRQHMDKISQALTNRGMTLDIINSVTQLESKRRSFLVTLEDMRHQRNVVSDEIAALKKSGGNADQFIQDMRVLSKQIKDTETELSNLETELDAIQYSLPNIPHESVPIGKDSAENPIIKKMGTPKIVDCEPLPHWTLGEQLGILDFERATKITGARFPLYFNAGARLERALINFMLDTHTQHHGYKETLPPFIVNRQSLTTTGQLPKFELDLFKLEQWEYYLVPTAEVPVTNIHYNEILDETQLPITYVAYTPCFRSEAGSYGRDTRGLIRQHQFNKVELVKLVAPETSYQELETLLQDAEKILQLLELPYQVVLLCTGDIGFSSAKTYDIEVWMPSQGVYREISSCSNFEAFQARRGSIRFRKQGKKGTDFVHTLNGSGLAVGRTFAAILENYQNKDGSVTIPTLLQPYMNGLQRIERP